MSRNTLINLRAYVHTIRIFTFYAFICNKKCHKTCSLQAGILFHHLNGYQLFKETHRITAFNLAVPTGDWDVKRKG